jgi:RHS repeat-associated protein
VGPKLLISIGNQRFLAVRSRIQELLRDYEPGTGRYVESDPIGLRGGVSTFGFGNADPLIPYDPKGLEPQSASNEQCCQFARGQVSETAEGTIVCCNGRKILCLWYQQPQGPEGAIIGRCRRQHESSHLNDGECPSQGCPVMFQVENRASHECAVYTEEVRCLRDAKRSCGKSVYCKQRIQAELDDREEQRDTWCSRAQSR